MAYGVTTCTPYLLYLCYRTPVCSNTRFPVCYSLLHVVIERQLSYNRLSAINIREVLCYRESQIVYNVKAFYVL